MRWVVLFLLSSSALAGDSRAEVFRRCSACVRTCLHEYGRGSERESCRCQCWRMKATDCGQNGHGPGPRNTCSCT